MEEEDAGARSLIDSSGQGSSLVYEVREQHPSLDGDCVLASRSYHQQLLSGEEAQVLREGIFAVYRWRLGGAEIVERPEFVLGEFPTVGFVEEVKLRRPDHVVELFTLYSHVRGCHDSGEYPVSLA